MSSEAEVDLQTARASKYDGGDERLALAFTWSSSIYTARAHQYVLTYTAMLYLDLPKPPSSCILNP